MWQESSDNMQTLQASMTDVVFRIQCKHLPVDHASALASAVCAYAPELNELPQAGIHPIHVAGSQNGWERPDQEGQLLLLSKRTRLRIRTDHSYASTLQQLLCGVTLEIDGFPLHIVSAQMRALLPSATLFSRYAYYQDLGAIPDENAFVERVVAQCRSLDFSPTKVLCGREHRVHSPEGKLLTRSVLLADVPAVDSVALQEHGLGDGRTIGCGLLIPHKDTGSVNQTPEG